MLPILQGPSAESAAASPRPEWLRVRAPTGPNYHRLKALIAEKRLHTVCSSAACPNIGECWERGTATFMILGNECTRACRFCDVRSSAKPLPVDLGEPARLALAVVDMDLRHVVITAVARDDLADGGAMQFVRCLNAVRERVAETRGAESRSANADLTLEVLTSDFEGNEAAIEMVLNAKPHVFNHNLETVERLTPKVRSKATYGRSLQVLAHAKRFANAQGLAIKTKSGIMLGMGEELHEVRQAITDLRTAGVDILTLGQYLRPSAWHLPVERFVHPNEFRELRATALALGFSHVEAGPLVRSSYHAEVGARV